VAYTPVIGPFDQANGSARSAVLHTARLDGTHVERLSEPGIDGRLEDYSAMFPPGGYVVFQRVRNRDLHVALFRMDTDGTDVRRLTPWGLDADTADVSLATSGPTEDLVVFETYGMGPPAGKSSDVATVPGTCTSPADCRSRIRLLTHTEPGARQAFNPSFSPDGRRIAFTDVRETQQDFLGDIATMRADGTHRHQVSHSPLFDFRPDWG
jgi:hypothetical protein